MAFQVSPGVEVKEIDLTNVIPAVSTSIGAFAGHFSWGPVGEVKLVSSEKELAAEYGTPNDTIGGASYDNYTSFLQASSFLKYGNALRISRACNSTAKNAAGSSRYGELVDTVKINNQDAFDALGDFGTKDGVIHARFPGKQGNSLKVFLASPLLAPTSSQAAGKFSDSAYDSLVNNIAGTTDWAAKNAALGYTDTDIDAKDEIHAVVVDQDGLFTGVPGTVLEVFEGLSLYSDASKDGGTNYYKTVINRDSKYIFINEAEFKNSFRANVSGALYAVPGSAATAGHLFSSSGLVLSTTITTISTAENNFGPTVNLDDIVAGTYFLSSESAGVTKTGSGEAAQFKVVITQDSSGPDEFSSNVTLLHGGSGFAANDTITFTEEALGGPTGTDESPDSSLVVTVSTVSNNNLFDYELYNGTDGIDAPDAGDIVAALAEFDNPEEIDINLLFAEGVNGDSLIHNEVIRIAGTARKDCVGFVSPDTTADSASDVTGDLNYNSSYIVQDSSAVYVYNKYNDSYRYIPANGHIAGLCARTDDTNDPWFSPAGYNRGNLLGVTKLKWNPKKSERDTLYKAGINPIISEPGQGILLFGDKTAQSKPSAFDRINVRRLFIVLEKAIATASKYQLFELNDEFTRAMFRNMTEPFLRDVKGRRGINDFLVVCDETNNTGSVIDANRFVADIYIKPARSINFITLNFIATRTGVEFSEIVGTGN
jgi:phage tail sheath protein FI